MQKFYDWGIIAIFAAKLGISSEEIPNFVKHTKRITI